MKKGKLEEAVKQGCKISEVLKLAQLYIVAQEGINQETLNKIKPLTLAQLKCDQGIKLKYNNLKLVDYVKKQEIKRFKQRVKRLLFTGISLASVYFLPLKIVCAIEANPTALQKVKSFIYEKNPEGEQKLNLKNVFLGTLGIGIVAGGIVFLANEDNRYGFKRLFFKPEILTNVVNAALTLDEREYINSIRQHSLEDIKTGRFLITTITMLPSIRHMLSTTFDIAEKNKDKILTSFLRVFACSVSLANKLTEYDVLSNEAIQKFPELTGIVGREIAYTTDILRSQQKEFLGMISQLVLNQPLLNIALDYLNYHKVDVLIKQKDVQFNTTLLKETAVDLIKYYNEKTANTTN